MRALTIDSQGAMDLLLKDDDYLGPNCYPVDDIKNLLVSYGSFEWVYALSEANRANHELARHALGLDNFVVWLEEVPTWFLSIILYDVASGPNIQ